MVVSSLRGRSAAPGAAEPRRQGPVREGVARDTFLTVLVLEQKSHNLQVPERSAVLHLGLLTHFSRR